MTSYPHSHIHNFKSAIPPCRHLPFEKSQILSSKVRALRGERQVSGTNQDPGENRGPFLTLGPHHMPFSVTQPHLGSPATIQNTRGPGLLQLVLGITRDRELSAKDTLGRSPRRGRAQGEGPASLFQQHRLGHTVSTCSAPFTRPSVARAHQA